MSKEIDDYTVYDITELRKNNELDRIEEDFHQASDGTFGSDKVFEWIKTDFKHIQKNKLRGFSDLDINNSSKEEIYEAFQEILEAYTSLVESSSSIESSVDNLENLVSEQCVQFQKLVEANENILLEYKDLLSLIDTLTGKIEKIEKSKWRLFEKFLTGL